MNSSSDSVITGNAIDYVLENPTKRILLHVCNAQGVMGSGIAREVKERIPSAYRRYIDSGYDLGGVSFSDGTSVANMVAQKNYGYDGKRYLDYGMLAKCLYQVHSLVNPYNKEYVIPYNMGSDRAGGDWGIVLELCKGILDEDNITIVKFNRGRQ